MNDLYEDMRNDVGDADPQLTRRVVDRWMREHAARRTRRRVLAVIAPLAAAALVALSFVLLHRPDPPQQPTGGALTSLIRDTPVASVAGPKQIDGAIDATTHLFSADMFLALIAADEPAEPAEPKP